jgi:hypothetical protein
VGGRRLGVERAHPFEQIVDSGRVDDRDHRQPFVHPQALRRETRQDQETAREQDERQHGGARPGRRCGRGDGHGRPRA